MQRLLSESTALSVSQEIVGISLSDTVTLKLQSLVFPAASVLVQITIVSPF